MTRPDGLESLYRVLQALGSTLELGPLVEALMDQVIDEIDRHSAGEPPIADITMVVIKRD